MKVRWDAICTSVCIAYGACPCLRPLSTFASRPRRTTSSACAAWPGRGGLPLRSCARSGTETVVSPARKSRSRRAAAPFSGFPALARIVFLSHPARPERTRTGHAPAKGHASLVVAAQHSAPDCPDGGPLLGTGVVTPPDGRSSRSPARVSPRSALAIPCVNSHTRFSPHRPHQLLRLHRLRAFSVVARSPPGMQLRRCCLVRPDEPGVDSASLAAAHPVLAP